MTVVWLALQDFQLGVKEADEFIADGTLPSGFLQPHEPSPPPPPPKPRRATKSKTKKQRSEPAVQVHTPCLPPLTVPS